jgi:chromosome segregation ATPase
MTRTLKLMTLGAFGVWLLTSTSCEDKVCKDALQTCKKESTDQRKECANNLSTIQELKSHLAEAQAKADTLSKENDELKAKAAEAETKGKGKAKKGKHKKRGKK